MSANDRQPGGNHYKPGAKLQHWDLVNDSTIDYLRGCASKYGYRWRSKGGLIDLDKCDHYLEKRLESLLTMTGVVPHDRLERFCEENELSPLETDLMFLILGSIEKDDFRKARLLVAKLRATAQEA